MLGRALGDVRGDAAAASSSAATYRQPVQPSSANAASSRPANWGQPGPQVRPVGRRAIRNRPAPPRWRCPDSRRWSCFRWISQIRLRWASGPPQAPPGAPAPPDAKPRFPQLIVTRLSCGGLPGAGSANPAGGAANDPQRADACHLLVRPFEAHLGVLVDHGEPRRPLRRTARPLRDHRDPQAHGILAYLIGFAAMTPFFNVGMSYEGPVAKAQPIRRDRGPHRVGRESAPRYEPPG